MPPSSSGSGRVAVLRVIIVALVVIFLVDLGAVIGMHTKKHSASPTTSTVPTSSVPTSTPASTSTAPATTAQTSPLTTPVTSPLTTPLTTPASTYVNPGTSSPVTYYPPPTYSPPPTYVTVPPTTPPTSATTTTVPTVPPAPPQGTYNYVTSGSATVGSQQSSLGPSTTIKVSSSGCGDQYVWQATGSSTDSTVECPVPGGLELASETFAGSIFFPQLLTCSNVILPISGSATGSTGSCTSSDAASKATVTVTVDGRPTVTLADGQVVPTTEDTVVIKFPTGQAESGTITTNYYLAADGVVVAESGSASLTTNSGAGSYSYNYRLNLTSLTPTP